MDLILYACIECGRPYPLDGAPYVCSKCGNIFDFGEPLPYDPRKIDLKQPGIWKYRHMFGLSEATQPVSLGEGNTPLVSAEVFGRKIYFKCEYQNPSGSFKDRGETVLVSYLRSRGIKSAIEDSSGNAGASFAAYAARAGMKAKVYIPAAASGPKRKQIENYGAELIPIEGTRSQVAEAVRVAADKGETYASHAYLPMNIPGYATAAYEIAEQLGSIPSAVIVPAGQGGFALGLVRGFESIRLAGITLALPKVIAVQAEVCAPLWALSTQGEAGLQSIKENDTLAEGVKNLNPIRYDAVIRAIQLSRGQFVTVAEKDILRGRDELAQIGLYVEPTSALVWSGLEQTIKDLPDPIVVILTGSGLKYSG